MDTRSIPAVVPPDLLLWRKATGADRRDEVWDGALHMAPLPTFGQRRQEFLLARWLDAHWAERAGGIVPPRPNVARPGRWPNDFRCPDILLGARERFRAVNRDESLDGAPEVVGEIAGPGDESRAKLAFHAAAGAHECWIVERDSKRPEIVRFERAAAPDPTALLPTPH